MSGLGGGGAHAGQDHGEGVVDGARPGALEEVDRGSDDLVEHEVADADFGEPAAGEASVALAGAGAVRHHLDRQMFEGVLADVDDLPGLGAGSLVQIDLDRGAPIEAQRHPRDPPVRGRRRAEEPQRAGGGGLLQGELEPLALNRLILGGAPGGGGVAVHRSRGALIGEELVLGTVGGGVGAEGTVEGDRAGVVAGMREDGQSSIGAIDPKRLETRRLRVPGREPDRPPALAPPPVGIRDDEHGVVVEGDGQVGV